jgi:hypothetical protein
MGLVFHETKMSNLKVIKAHILSHHKVSAHALVLWTLEYQALLADDPLGLF